MTKNTAFALVFGMVSLGTLGASLAPASAQDRTPPSDGLTALQPTIDLRPGQVFVTQGAIYGVDEGRSVVVMPADPRDQADELDR